VCNISVGCDSAAMLANDGVRWLVRLYSCGNVG
jgi:hypothetical protein